MRIKSFLSKLFSRRKQVIGIDWGLEGDETTLVVLEKLPDGTVSIVDVQRWAYEEGAKVCQIPNKYWEVKDD